MKRSTFYMIALVGAAIVLLLLLNNKRNPSSKTLDERVTFRKEDKIPYGAYVAYNNLRHIFPGASVSSDNKKPGYWDSLRIFDQHQLLLVISPQFYPEASEMEKLIRFAGAGNTVFISTQRLSYAAQSKLNCEITDRTMPYHTSSEQQRLVLSLASPFYKNPADTFSYPGKSEIAWFDKYDTAVSQVMGMHSNGYPNFLRMRTGQGQIYLQISPFAFTNYFLLHKANMNYYDQVLSAVQPGEVQKVVWDEYFLKKKYLSGDYFNNETSSSSGKNWFGTLMEYRPFRYAFWVMILLMIIYVLIEMRRKQRYIPVINKPRNDSLDFVKTIGRLYHQKKDHKNLAQKMGAYFLEHIRGQYKLPTNRLDEAFVKALHYKSGYDEKELYFLTRFIQDIPNLPALSDHQLVDFQRRLEHFYKHT